MPYGGHHTIRNSTNPLGGGPTPHAMKTRGAGQHPVDYYHVCFELEDGHRLIQLPVLQELGHDLER